MKKSQETHVALPPVFLRTSDLAAFTGMSLKMARKVLAEAGLQPVDVNGKKGRLLWHRDAVKAVLDTLHMEAQNKANQVPRRPRKTFTVTGKSIDRLMDELRA